MRYEPQQGRATRIAAMTHQRQDSHEVYCTASNEEQCNDVMTLWERTSGTTAQRNVALKGVLERRGAVKRHNTHNTDITLRRTEGQQTARRGNRKAL